jgi:shikimate dehydrogenase
MKVTGRTKLLALFGDPVAHSLSPLMHNAWIADHGLEACYIALRVDTSGADGFFAHLKSAGFFGANVTVPHKDRAFRIADHVDPIGQRLGAVNTLRWGADSTIDAINSDVYGLIAALEEGAPGWRHRHDKACVIGAGGAAKAAIAALQEVGIKDIRILNRTHARAESLARDLGGAAFAWEHAVAAMDHVGVIINTTSAALDDDSALGDLPFENAAKHALAFDMMYGKRSHFLEGAARAGHAVLDGMPMLAHQGALAFEFWFGAKPDTRLALARLRDALKGSA